ncbi:hypothetical protein SAMN05660690_4310 [Geodermatophilus telluris]|uniref:Uncharacterized protein n=1 Tax=Geodermatophilus telluris TaxID=1190417 RepID=A0A1G6V476_9ACTN|nr:hypothetical protein [Geodermatophilus telluris]SDD47705.1 hypothetical protein SAMN05660690_4310 [Geodermatophilus telluris]
MSASGGRTVADLLLLLRVAAASLAGGLSAVVVLWVAEDGLPQPGVLLALVLLVTVLSVLASAALVSDRRSPGPPAGSPVPPVPHPAAPRPAPPALPPAPALPSGRRYDPAGGGPGRAAPAPALPVFTPPKPVPVRAASPPTWETHPVPGAARDAGAVRRLVQCPRCGDFGVEARRRAAVFAFTCRRCAHTWQWGRGSPWPATVVRPPGAERGPGPVPPRRSP